MEVVRAAAKRESRAHPTGGEVIYDPGREHGTGDPADEPEIQEDQERDRDEERARDDDDLGEEAPLGPGPSRR